MKNLFNLMFFIVLVSCSAKEPSKKPMRKNELLEIREELKSYKRESNKDQRITLLFSLYDDLVERVGRLEKKVVDKDNADRL